MRSTENIRFGSFTAAVVVSLVLNSENWEVSWASSSRS